MIDYDKIGKRILEQRKHILGISQERMAEELNLYQADISNLEKAKRGSGITDLSRLDLVADYLNLPLETLLFGMGDPNMLTYQGSRMELKAVRKKKIRKTHQEILQMLAGRTDEIRPGEIYECGPYTIYILTEMQYQFGAKAYIDEDGKPAGADYMLPRPHLFVFYGAEVIATLMAAYSTVMQHVFEPAFKGLVSMIQRDVLDVTDVWRTLNPYWALYMFAEDEAEEEEYRKKMYERMDALREDPDLPILYIESIYVREDCRRKGICRLCIDVLKAKFGDSILWLNLEPTSGAELESEHTQVTCYSVSELGQLNLNASIAERLGFTVDPDTWHRNAEVLDADGNRTTETVLIRKCAYYLPKRIREIVKNDDGLVSLGRARQHVRQSQDTEPGRGMADISHRWIGSRFYSEVRYSMPGKGHTYATAVYDREDGKRYYAVSYGSLMRDKDPRILREYDSLDEASEDKFLEELEMADVLLYVTGEVPRPCPYEEGDEGETFEILDAFGYAFPTVDGERTVRVREFKLLRTNTDQAGEILYAMIADGEKGSTYALNRKSFRDFFEEESEEEDPEEDEESVTEEADLEPVISCDSEKELAESGYAHLFMQLLELAEKLSFEEELQTAGQSGEGEGCGDLERTE